MYVQRPMDMRTGRTPGRSDIPDNILRRHLLPFLSGKSGHMQIDGFHALTMIDRHRSATQVVLFHQLYNTRRNRVNRRPRRAALIHPGVKIAGRLAVLQPHSAERRRQAPRHRRRKRLLPIARFRNFFAEITNRLLLAGRRLQAGNSGRDGERSGQSKVGV